MDQNDFHFCTLVQENLAPAWRQVEVALTSFETLQKCVWRGLQGGHVEGVTGWTAPPIEDPPDLKKAE